MTAGRDFAVLTRGQDGAWTKLDGADKKEEITDFLCIPYAQISGTYRTVDRAGEPLAVFPEAVLTGWETTPPAMTPVISGGAAAQMWQQDMTGTLTLNEAKTEGTWQLENIPMFDPETYDAYLTGAILESMGEDFTVRYLNEAPFDTESETGYDGGVIEACYGADFAYGAKLDINWNESSDRNRRSDLSFLHIYDEAGREVTETITMKEVSGDSKRTSIFLEGLKEDQVYQIKADSILGYRTEIPQAELSAVLMKEGEDGSGLTAGLTLAYTQVKSVAGTIHWEDEADKYGMRPDKEVLSGLISGDLKVQTTDGIMAHMINDSDREAMVWVSQDADIWTFAVTNVDWDATVTLPELVGYEVEKQEARTRSSYPRQPNRRNHGRWPDHPGYGRQQEERRKRRKRWRRWRWNTTETDYYHSTRRGATGTRLYASSTGD